MKNGVMRSEGGLDELHHAIVHLLGSVYVTGRVLPLDGGRHLR